MKLENELGNFDCIRDTDRLYHNNLSTFFSPTHPSCGHILRTGLIRRTQGKKRGSVMDRLLSESHVYLTNFKCILTIGELNSYICMG